MKNSTNFLSIFLFAATLVSCHKENLQQTTEPVVTNQPTILSEWFSIAFSPTSTTQTNSSTVLVGSYTIGSTVKYEDSKTVQIAYAKIPGRVRYYYSQLPSLCHATGENVQLNFGLTADLFSVKITNVDSPSLLPNADPFQYIRFRYLVIPKTVYQNTNIDWNDYYKVAGAFNLSL